MTEQCLFPKGCIAVLGMFDGVHIGHQALLKRASEIKQQTKLPVVMITFTHHPKTLFGKKPDMLTTNEQKKRLAIGYGADDIVFEPFDQKMRNLSPKQFIQHYLMQKINAHYVVVGENYRFGYQHEGTANLLTEYQNYFSAEIVPAVKIHAFTVSSSKIRELLRQGNLEEALLFLGHSLEVEGKVEQGRQVGRKLGFCTANVNGLFPPLKHGVYLTRCLLENQWVPSISNFGIAPTFSLGNTERLECHLLGFQGDLYQKDITIRFEMFVRPEITFQNEKDLASCVQKDIVKAKKYFLEHP